MSRPAHRNVELKAVNRDPEGAVCTCRRLGAVDHGVLRQRDRYFVVPVGSLKLREQTPGECQLIQYRRPTQAEPRLSAYRIVTVDDADGLALALTGALGAGPEVVKDRHLFIWEGVRIHLDRVRGLGEFIEFEAVAAADSDLAREHALVRQLRDEFRINDADLIAEGYARRLTDAGR